MFNFEITGDFDTGTLVLTGMLTVEHSLDIKNVLIEVLSRYNKVLLRLENPEKIDLSCIQLFYSARKSALKRNKALFLISPPKDFGQFWDLVRLCGFVAYSNKESFSPEISEFIVEEGPET